MTRIAENEFSMNGRRRGTLLLLALLIVAIGSSCSQNKSAKTDTASRNQPSGGSTATGTASTDPSGPVQTGNQDEQTIDPLAAIGDPPMDAQEAAFAKQVQQVLAADPRISSKHIYVAATHNFNGKRYNEGDLWNGMRVTSPWVVIAGSVSSVEEFNAVRDDLIKNGWTAMNSLSIAKAQTTQTTQTAQTGDAPGAWSEPPAPEKPNISLCPGLTIVTAIASGGDYESIKTVESVDAKQVRMKYSSESSRPWWEVPPAQRNCEASAPGCAITKFVTRRIVLASDLESAHKYDQIFVTDKNASATSPGATAIGISAAALRELKTTGESQVSLCAGADDIFEKTSDGQMHPIPGGCFAWGPPIKMTRVGNGPTTVRVILNGAPVDLPAVQASGVHGPRKYSDRDEFFFLDDERNPIALKFRLGIGAIPALDPQTRQKCEVARTQGNLSLSGDDPPSCDLPEGGDRDVLTVTKINTRCELPRSAANRGSDGTGSGASALEKSLAETGKVDIYSIYFSFNSDRLREESQPTLQDIAEVMRRHPDWKLQVNGHTDGIGGDQFNLDLSKRRAAAVKSALTKQYKINSGRLATSGFGKSQPKDTNDTLEGRARNRRVELMKIG